jgi:hypothetical protein
MLRREEARWVAHLAMKTGELANTTFTIFNIQETTNDI